MLLSDRTLVMVIDGNVLQSHFMEAAIPQGSHVKLMVFTILTAGIMMWAEVRVEAKHLLWVDNDRCMASRKDVKHTKQSETKVLAKQKQCNKLTTTIVTTKGPRQSMLHVELTPE